MDVIRVFDLGDHKAVKSVGRALDYRDDVLITPRCVAGVHADRSHLPRELPGTARHERLTRPEKISEFGEWEAVFIWLSTPC